MKMVLLFLSASFFLANSASLVYSMLILLAFFLFWIKFRKPSLVEKQITAIQGPSTLWFCWSMLKYSWNGTLNVDLQQLLSGLSHLYDKNYMYRVWLANIPLVVLFKAETIEPLLSSEEFLERAPEYNYGSPLIGNGLITSPVERWRKRRKLLNPAFHYRILEDCMPTFNRQCKVLIKKLKQHSDTKEPVDIVPLIQHCALDIICETAMGVDIGSQCGNNVEYVQALHRVTEILPERVMQPWLHPDVIFNNISLGREFKKALKTVQNFTKRIISERKKMLLNNPEMMRDLKTNEKDSEFGIKRKLAFLDLLLYHHLCDNELSEADVQGEVDTFMFAGHDTASVSVPWALFMIGNDQQIQNNIHRELDAIFSGDKERPITFDDLREMNYLKCVAKETLRLYPPGGIIGRILPKDLTLKNHVVPGRTRCLLFIYQLHRDPRYFPNPEAFKPERFFPSSLVEQHPYTYIPFSAGPRNCIGQKFALLEMQTLVANILRNFTVQSLDTRDKIKLAMEVVLRPASPIRMHFTPR